MAFEAVPASSPNQPEARESAVRITLEQLEQDIESRLGAVPEALELYKELDLHGKTIEAKNVAEQELARAQRILNALSGLREEYEQRTQGKVVGIETGRVVKALALLEATAEAQVHIRALEADAFNTDQRISAMQEKVLGQSGSANDDNYHASA
jgi:hypothetical protein